MSDQDCNADDLKLVLVLWFFIFLTPYICIILVIKLNNPVLFTFITIIIWFPACVIFVGIRELSPKNLNEIKIRDKSVKNYVKNYFQQLNYATDKPLKSNISFEEDPYIAKCVVCDLLIYENEEFTTCPICNAIAHRTHLLEWLKIKGFCPNCGQHIPSISLMRVCQIY